ncbi:S-layer family protein, partial [Pseudanabaenaceae cyanobacterium LEGE 13415]|nr:S-layer family protein [Pseudanabaenaceae cyanobacterium LEGE 13415]
QVPENQSLILLGGEVSLAGGGMNAAGGRVELGAVAGSGAVELSLEDNRLSLNFPATLDRADIALIDGATVTTSGEGGGSIQIWGRRVLMNNGSQVTASAQGASPGGRLTVNASELLEVVGFAPFGNLSTLSLGDGKAGDVLIETRAMRIRDGAQIVSASLGNGSAGQLTVNASESAEVVGLDSAGFSSFLGVFTSSAGQAGNLTINTGRLIIQDGGALSAESLIFENEKALPGTGNGGNLTINASDSIELRRGFIFAGTQGSGNAGNLTINTDRLLVQDSSTIGARSQGSGNAGNILVQARSVTLSNQARIDAATTSSQGGNITLQVQDVLLLRQGSLISTTAGMGQAGGNGGNITIDGKFIVAVPRENSDITANAFLGRGGNIRITTQGIFGIEQRFRETGLSDITASSEFGISGTITLNTPDVDSSPGIVSLPTEIQDTSQLIASTCPADEGNSFAITGRGGLPQDPRQPLMSDSVWLDDRSPRQAALSPSSPGETNPSANPATEEAQGWIKQPDGSIHLVANYPGRTTQAVYPIPCAVPSR